MSTISVSNITTANGTENLVLGTGNTSGNKIIVNAAGGVSVNGDVGIGVSTPTYKLDVVGAGDTTAAIRSTTSGAGLLRLIAPNTALAAFNQVQSLSGATVNWSLGGDGNENTLVVKTNATEQMRVNTSGAAFITNVTITGGNLVVPSGNVNFDAGALFVDSVNGRVGISNTVPDAALTVGGAANVTGLSRFGGNVTMAGTLQTISGNVNMDSGVLFVDATNNRVGVNQTSPDASLTVTGTANVSGVTRFAANVTMAGTLQTISGNVNMDSGVLFVDATNNRVGINQTAPDAALQVTGSANVSAVSRFGANLNVVGNLNISSTLGNTGWVMLNSGLKMNWGVIAANSSTLGNATFSSAFATGPYSVTMTGANSLGNTCWSAGVNSTVVQVRSSNTSSTGGLVYYMAIGI